MRLSLPQATIVPTISTAKTKQTDGLLIGGLFCFTFTDRTGYPHFLSYFSVFFFYSLSLSLKQIYKCKITHKYNKK